MGITDELIEQAENVDNQTKLAVTAWVFHHIIEHAKEGGTFRYLIYDRLGFGYDAYVPLCADGMTISNEFNMDFKDKVVRIAQEHQLEPLKEVLEMCDEPGCFKIRCCGWPDPKTNTYRVTCRDHAGIDVP
jgi:hypothetical protein